MKHDGGKPSEVPYTGHSPIHIIRAERLRSPFFLTQVDDRGSLRLTPHRIVFNGMQGVVECPGVKSVELVRMPFPWFAGLLLLAAFTGALALLRSSQGVHPAVVLLVALFVAAWCLQVWSRLLIRVDYHINESESCTVYLLSDPPFASSRKATRLLHEEIRAKVLGPAKG